MDHVADPKYFGFSFSLLLKPQKLHWNFNTFLDEHWPLNLTARLYPYCWQVSNRVSYTALELVGVVWLVNQLCTLIIFIFNSLLSYIYCMFVPSVPPFSRFFFPSISCSLYDVLGLFWGLFWYWNQMSLFDGLDWHCCRNHEQKIDTMKLGKSEQRKQKWWD